MPKVVVQGLFKEVKTLHFEVVFPPSPSCSPYCFIPGSTHTQQQQQWVGSPPECECVCVKVLQCCKSSTLTTSGQNLVALSCLVFAGGYVILVRGYIHVQRAKAPTRITCLTLGHCASLQVHT